LVKYKAGEAYTIRISFNTETRSYTMNINGKEISTQLFFMPAATLERIVFRTGPVRRFPDADTPTDQLFDVPNAGEAAPLASFMIAGLTTKNEDK
ncbi:MAG: six-hairpin glycosidase, partial [Bacteroidetes bacterium]|nr:six-hairpin glycosidase [Bacteroidota bacterium]